ncbi:VOC family protein [Angustibacter aerolatus]
MAGSVAAVWVPVDDMQRAVDFYTGVLRLELKSQSDDWSEIDASGLLIGLNGREGTSAHSDGGAVISFTPEGSIDDEYARLQSAGATVTGEISDHPWGRIAPFKDTEGNDLQLYAPPSE